jgi:hypothetical protein
MKCLAISSSSTALIRKEKGAKILLFAPQFIDSTQGFTLTCRHGIPILHFKHFIALTLDALFLIAELTLDHHYSSQFLDDGAMSVAGFLDVGV